MEDKLITTIFLCDKCKYCKMIMTTDETYLVCTNDKTKSSWPDYHNCKYYEEEKK